MTARTINPATQIMILRIGARRMQSQLATLGIARAQALREQERLQGGPFNKQRLEQLRIRLCAIDLMSRRYCEGQRNVGANLVRVADEMDAVSTLDQRLDLLNTNDADRRGLPQDARFIDLVLEYDVEDSAARRGSGDYGALGAAIAVVARGARQEAKSVIRCAAAGHMVLRMVSGGGGANA